MCEPTTIAIAGAVAAAAGTAATIYNGQQQQKEMKKANQQAKAASDRQLALAEQEMNKVDAKSPNVQGMRNQNAMAEGENATATMLTGAGGVDPSKLTLGKNTLLGL